GGRIRSRSCQRRTRAGLREDRLPVDRDRRRSYRSFMPPLEAFGPTLAIGLILFVMLWFALGTQRNIRRGNALLEWLQGGLPIIGPRTTLRWLGSSAVELHVADAVAPF